MATDSELRMKIPVFRTTSRFGVAGTNGNGSDNFHAFMDRCKAVLIVFLCFGLLVSFLLLIIAVAKPQAFEGVNNDVCSTKTKNKTGFATDKRLCKNNETNLDCVLRFMTRLNRSELLAVRQTIDTTTRINGVSVSKHPALEENSESKWKPKNSTQEVCFKDVSLKIHETRVCVFAKRLDDLYKSCQNRTRRKLKFHPTFGNVIVKFVS